ncbi:MAG: transcription antitermination factor NusB [Parafannyhessea sp.]|uniref:transcription antitermination factor NusB n=1 Tax=Parafannyhessea sp. TaxID=2847324 RepID=UPI003F09BB94
MSEKSIHFGGRTLARCQALQLLFQAEATDRTVHEVLEGGDYAISEGPLDPFGEMLARGADDMRGDLDAVISATSSNWSVSRMPAVDRNLLRLALYEMLEVDEVAIAVTIDESVELAKAFGSDESSRFVNGVLGRVATKLENGTDVIAEARALAAKRAEEKAESGEDDAPEDSAEAEGDTESQADDAAESPESGE